jgi:Domain of unknown function (DUF6504)
MPDPPDPQHRSFVCEAITPVDTSFDTASMSVGEPGLPKRFVWRGTEYEIARVLETWKTTGGCRHGSGELYVRRHCYRVEMVDGTRMDIYFDRQTRTRSSKKRWWLASLTEPHPRGA